MKKYLHLIVLALTTSLISDVVIANSDTLPANGEAMIAAGKIKEVCFPAKPPIQISYQFSAEKPLNFNIHFHKDKTVFYPIKQDNILSTQGLFTPESDQFYCMMWSNKQDVDVSIQFKIYEK